MRVITFSMDHMDVRCFYVGHDYVNHNYAGHNCIGNNCVSCNYVGHNYISYNYTCHRCVGHNCTCGYCIHVAVHKAFEARNVEPSRNAKVEIRKVEASPTAGVEQALR